MWRLFVVILAVGVIGFGYCPSISASSPYFPMTSGMEWVYSMYSTLQDSIICHDTVRVDGEQFTQGKQFYHLSTPWIPIFAVWVRADSLGDLYWCDAPGGPENPLLLFSSPEDGGWVMGGRFCSDSAVRNSCHGPIETPAGSFNNVICMNNESRPGDCGHAGWSAAFADGVGPVKWAFIGVGGAGFEWELLEHSSPQPSSCKCHGDPVCDGVFDVLDVLATVNVAFRNGPPLIDSGCSWYAHQMHGRTDFDRSGATDIMDVARIVGIAFRGDDPE